MEVTEQKQILGPARFAAGPPTVRFLEHLGHKEISRWRPPYVNTAQSWHALYGNQEQQDVSLQVVFLHQYVPVDGSRPSQLSAFRKSHTCVFLSKMDGL
jgi:hypothetical protein